MSHQRSFYLMWPPRALSKDGAYMRIPYTSWLRSSVATGGGLQTRLITGKSHKCDIRLARARLNMLTDVQLLSHLNLTSYCGPGCSLVHLHPRHAVTEEETRATDAEIARHKKEVKDATHCDRRLLDVIFSSRSRRKAQGQR